MRQYLLKRMLASHTVCSVLMRIALVEQIITKHIVSQPKHGTGGQVKKMNDNTRNTIESLEEYKKGLLRSIAIGIQATNRNDDYSVGLRNGLRVCKAYIDGLEPEYEKCKPSAEPEPHWIPTSKERPPQHQEIWITDDLGTVELVYGKDGIWWLDDNYYTEPEIIAWMPANVPEPYKPEEEAE